MLRSARATTRRPQGGGDPLTGSTLFLLVFFLDQVKYVVLKPVEMFIYAGDVNFAIRVKDDGDARLFQSMSDDFAH